MRNDLSRYAPEFRDEVARLANSDNKPRNAIDDDLSVSYDTLSQWIKKPAMDAGERQGQPD